MVICLILYKGKIPLSWEVLFLPSNLPQPHRGPPPRACHPSRGTGEVLSQCLPYAPCDGHSDCYSCGLTRGSLKSSLRVLEGPSFVTEMQTKNFPFGSI